MIDVVITSTCRMELQRCLDSFKQKVHCSEGFNFLVNIDVRNKKLLPRVINILRRHNIHNVRINNAPAPSPDGHVDAINTLYRSVNARYYFSLEDDWIFLRDIDLDKYISIMNKHKTIDHIRYSKERIKDYSWLYYKSMYDNPEARRTNLNMMFEEIPLVKAHTLSFNPSINRSSTIQNLLPVPHSVNPEQYLCIEYERTHNASGSYIAGVIGDPPWVKDIGRNQLKEMLRKGKQYIKMLLQNQVKAK